MSVLAALALFGALTACGTLPGNDSVAYVAGSRLTSQPPAPPPIVAAQAVRAEAPQATLPPIAGTQVVQLVATVPVVAAPPSTDVGTFQGSVFRWSRVGGDRCNDRVGCTIRWGLQQSGWPSQVQEALLNKALTEAGREVTITRGWQGWMTWGSQVRKFHPNTVADFDQNEPATEWSEVYAGQEYVLIRVHRCRNPGGYIRQPTHHQLARHGFPPIACPP